MTGDGRRLRPGFVALALLWGWGIWQLSAEPAVPGPAPFVQQLTWNGGHAAVYAVLALLMLAGLPRAAGWWGAALLLCSVYGMADEWHQSFVPGRVAAVTDWVTDSFGVLFGLSVVLLAASPSRRAWVRVVGAGVACVAAALVATLA